MTLTWAVADATSAMWHAVQKADEENHPERDSIRGVYERLVALGSRIENSSEETK